MVHKSIKSAYKPDWFWHLTRNYHTESNHENLGWLCFLWLTLAREWHNYPDMQTKVKLLIENNLFLCYLDNCFCYINNLLSKVYDFALGVFVDAFVCFVLVLFSKTEHHYVIWLASNLRASSLCLLNVWITGVHCHTQSWLFFRFVSVLVSYSNIHGQG
jgi:hypothetical protein